MVHISKPLLTSKLPVRNVRQSENKNRNILEGNRIIHLFSQLYQTYSVHTLSIIVLEITVKTRCIQIFFKFAVVRYCFDLMNTLKRATQL